MFHTEPSAVILLLCCLFQTLNTFTKGGTAHIVPTSSPQQLVSLLGNSQPVTTLDSQAQVSTVLYHPWRIVSDGTTASVTTSPSRGDGTKQQGASLGLHGSHPGDVTVDAADVTGSSRGNEAVVDSDGSGRVVQEGLHITHCADVTVHTADVTSGEHSNEVVVSSDGSGVVVEESFVDEASDLVLYLDSSGTTTDTTGAPKGETQAPPGEDCVAPKML